LGILIVSSDAEEVAGLAIVLSFWRMVASLPNWGRRLLPPN